MMDEINDNTTMSPDEDIHLSLSYQGTPYTWTFHQSATISDLSDAVADDFSVPFYNQKFMISKLGTFKPPFKDPELPLLSIIDKKITLIGSTSKEANAVAEAAQQASNLTKRKPVQRVKAFKRHDWKKEQEESQYTFTTLRPLSHLPNSERSLQFLQRLKDDAGIKASMRKHKFTVPLLTEMDPTEHTQSNHEGTTRTLGLNRNGGEVIELRLRTDRYDGYRDYKTIRKTLCHELAHNVWGPHDRNFWDLCKQIEKEVEGADWRSGGHSLGNDEYYEGGNEIDDHGGWTGGEFVLGGSSSAAGHGSTQGMSRSEILAKAAEERLKKNREQSGQSDNTGTGGH